MKFLEKDLEDIIWESDRDMLMDRGLYLHHRKKRQLRIGNYGIADIVAFAGIPEDQYTRGILDVQIVELKKGVVDAKTVGQALRYAVGIKKYVTGFRRKFDLCLRTNIICIGDKIDDDDLFYLSEFNHHFDVDINFEFYTYRYGWDGIEFNEHSHREKNRNGDHGFGERPIEKYWAYDFITPNN